MISTNGYLKYSSDDDCDLSLVCLHYLALLLLELRHQGQPQFYIKVDFGIQRFPLSLSEYNFSNLS